MKDFLSLAIRELVNNDRELLNPNRNLDEVAINHRLAVYMESYLLGYFPQEYSVDMECDMNYENKKMLPIDGFMGARRPDILVHSRTDNSFEIQHLLVVEAKRGFSSNYDTKKIKGFIEHEYYNYLFGMTIFYCYNPLLVIAKLYYCDDKGITFEEMNERK